MDDVEWTALMIATSAGKKDVVALLLNKGANVNTVNRTGTYQQQILDFCCCCLFLLFIRFLFNGPQ